MIALLAITLASTPIAVDVYVPLCDSALIACGRGAAGDPRSLEANLYWGAMYGAERYLSKASGFKVVSKKDVGGPALLREVVVERTSKTERVVRMRLLAYAGDRIDDALADFLRAAGGASSADLVVWAGHDRLMDVAAPKLQKAVAPKPVAVLACSSQEFFGPVLAEGGIPAIALTRSFMAPEAYLLEALAASVAARGVGDPVALRQALIGAYAKYQKISEKAAGTVFSKLPAEASR